MARRIKHSTLYRYGAVALAVLLLVAVGIVGKPASHFSGVVQAKAACPSTDNVGNSTMSATMPFEGDYVIWSRIQSPVNSGSMYLQVDSTCYKVVASGLTVGEWGWLDFENGARGQVVKQHLTAGAHTVAVIGDTPSLKVDRLILTASDCVPQKGTTGDNCAQLIDSPPSVVFDSPLTGATLKDVTRISATAVDDGTLSKVDFFVDASATPIKTLSTAPYSFDWDPSSVSNGAHTLSAKAYDNSGQVGSSLVNVTVDVPPPNPDGSVYITAPKSGAKISGKDIILSARIRPELSGVQTLQFLLDGTRDLGTAKLLGGAYTLNWDSSGISVGAHSLVARATTAKGTVDSTPVSITIQPPSDQTPPTKPTKLHLVKPPSKTKVTLTWTASTDNSGGKIRYYLYLNGQLRTRQATVTHSFGNLSPSTTYVAKVIAVDEAGNQSQPASVRFKTKAACLLGVCVP